MVVDKRKGAFQVKCISSGGRALNMSITGPARHKHKRRSIEAVGDPHGMGNDMFSVSSTNLFQDGDVYQCTASNGVPPNQTNSTELRGSCLLFRDRIRYYFTFHSCLSSYHNITGADISHCCESGVESAIRKSHSDWLCSTLQ